MEPNLESVKYGVPQGSLIGPPSFSINVHDISDCIESDLDQLADDTTTYRTGPTADAALDSLQNSARQLERYAKWNSLKRFTLVNQGGQDPDTKPRAGGGVNFFSKL